MQSTLSFDFINEAMGNQLQSLSPVLTVEIAANPSQRAAILADLRQVKQTVKDKYRKAGREFLWVFRWRMVCSLLRYTAWTLITREEKEYQFFCSLMEAAPCTGWLDICAYCIKIFGGLEADDRDAFKERLRKDYKQKAAQLEAKPCYGECCHWHGYPGRGKG